MHAVKHGLTSRAIAQRRGISVDAIKFHVSNAMAKLALHSRKSLRQWFHAPKESALNRKEQTVDAPHKLGPIGQISRSVKDINQAQNWYGKVLGLPPLYAFGNMAFYKDPEGRPLAIMSKVKAN